MGWVTILFPLFLTLVLMARVTSLSAGLGPTAKVDLNSGAFTIVRDGNEEIWLSSDGKGVFLRHHGARYGVDDGSLLLVNGSIWKGRDAWGTFKEFTLTYEADPGDGSNVLQMVATIRQSRRAVTFEQVFFRMPGLENCSAGDADGLATAFPVFDLPEAGGGGAGMPTSQCAWTSWDYTAKGADGVSLEAPGFASPTCRAWDAAHAASFPAGLAGTGPMILWPESDAQASSSSNAMVLSPMLNVMALNLAVLPAAATGAATSRVAFGVMGAVSAVPAGFAARVVAFFGTEGAGINGAMAEWGAAMRRWTGKAHAGANRLSDITLKYLGYSTDNGAYYYYHTDDGGEGKKKRKLRSSAQISYQETLVNVRQRHQVEQEDMHRKRGESSGHYQAQEQHAHVAGDTPAQQRMPTEAIAPSSPVQHSSPTQQPPTKVNTTEDEWGDDEDVAGLLA